VLDDFGVDSVAVGARPTPKALIARRSSAICWTSNDDGVPMSDNTLNKDGTALLPRSSSN
jgi:hypothetical protein